MRGSPVPSGESSCILLTRGGRLAAGVCRQTRTWGWRWTGFGSMGSRPHLITRCRCQAVGGLRSKNHSGSHVVGWWSPVDDHTPACGHDANQALVYIPWSLGPNSTSPFPPALFSATYLPEEILRKLPPRCLLWGNKSKAPLCVLREAPETHPF